jgi:two-component system, response regulator PdtaR
VVEDDPLVRDFAVMLLEDHGFCVRAADCADAALALLDAEAASRTAVVFTDVQMPGTIDGADLARIIGDRWPGVSIIVTSGAGHPGGTLPSSARFIPKPWAAEAIISQIAQDVGRRS